MTARARMFQLKPIDAQNVPRALDKAERYRLLHEPREAESICRDILGVAPRNQEAIICLTLALTDVFPATQNELEEARGLAAQLDDEYSREYFTGVVEERWAKALLRTHHTIESVYTTLRSAMEHFDRADALAPDGNDDAALRWNTCVRLLDRHAFTPPEEHAQDEEEIFDEDMPAR
jgi:hypothetical protein